MWHRGRKEEIHFLPEVTVWTVEEPIVAAADVVAEEMEVAIDPHGTSCVSTSCYIGRRAGPTSRIRPTRGTVR
jgi:hypothetical protein